jgi:hypothetical protein
VTALSWIVYAVGVVLDILSTDRAIARGTGRESSTRMLVAGSKWMLVRIGLGVVVAIATIYVDEPLASWIRVALGAFYIVTAVRNFRIARGGD